MPTTFCGVCGGAVSGNYCARCGARASRSSVQSRERVAWLATGALSLLALLVLLIPARRKSDPAGAAPAGVAEAGNPTSPPDLGSMSLRERFDRLYNRVMQAAEAGKNSAEVARFSPMAFAAYSQLDSVDADARYHAAVLHLHVASDPGAALRLADSIAQGAPRHLFAILIRGTAARQSGNGTLLARSEREFLEAWESEMRENRAEYLDHRNILNEFHEAALRARSSAGARRP
jgi:hypothetical protein